MPLFPCEILTCSVRLFDKGRGFVLNLDDPIRLWMGVKNKSQHSHSENIISKREFKTIYNGAISWEKWEWSQ